MAVGLIGRKIGMTRIFREDGSVVPVTIIEAGPCPVIRVQTKNQNGYDSVQVGFANISKNRLTKPLSGQFPDNVPAKRFLKEFRLNEDETGKYNVGDVLLVDMFEPGQHVDVRGITKGRGTAGVIKRHGFQGGPGGHGSMFHRLPGSIGNNSDPHRVFKGKRMSGRFGATQVCVQNLEVIQINKEDHTIAVRGAIPGASDGIVAIIPPAKRQKKSAGK